jgi:hypothetical protein
MSRVRWRGVGGGSTSRQGRATPLSHSFGFEMVLAQKTNYVARCRFAAAVGHRRSPHANAFVRCGAPPVECLLSRITLPGG